MSDKIHKVDHLDDLKRALDHLTVSCEVMAQIAATLSRIDPIRRRPNSYAGLARTIAFQQISTKAGMAIWGRLEEHLAPVTAEHIHATASETILECGFSRQKALYLKSLAQACVERRLDFDRLEQSSDDVVREELLAIKGIGPWTVDIYLMFSLGRADVFPAGDLALLESYRRHAGLDDRPNPLEMSRIAGKWRPWRSVAAHLLWSGYSSGPTERLAW